MAYCKLRDVVNLEISLIIFRKQLEEPSMNSHITLISQQEATPLSAQSLIDPATKDLLYCTLETLINKTYLCPIYD